jgi:hypothetical protein
MRHPGLMTPDFASLNPGYVCYNSHWWRTLGASVKRRHILFQVLVVGSVLIPASAGHADVQCARLSVEVREASGSLHTCQPAKWVCFATGPHGIHGRGWSNDRALAEQFALSYCNRHGGSCSVSRCTQRGGTASVSARKPASITTREKAEKGKPELDDCQSAYFAAVALCRDRHRKGLAYQQCVKRAKKQYEWCM